MIENDIKLLNLKPLLYIKHLFLLYCLLRYTFSVDIYGFSFLKPLCSDYDWSYKDFEKSLEEPKILFLRTLFLPTPFDFQVYFLYVFSLLDMFLILLNMTLSECLLRLR